LIIGLVWFARGVFGGETTSSPVEPANESVAVTEVTEEVVTEEVIAVNTDPVNCVPSALLVEATTDSSTYRVGAKPVLTVTIENRGSVACLRDVGPKANELKIESGGYHVWSSDDCNDSKKSKVVTLEPGDKVVSSITWNGKLSQKGCPDISTSAKAGRYVVIGRNLKLTSDPTPFALTSKN
jgi:hypothetical protein